MGERNYPQNSCLEMVRMIEGADLQDLLIIFEQFEQEKELYTMKEANDILFCITKRREIVEANQRIDKIKKRL